MEKIVVTQPDATLPFPDGYVPVMVNGMPKLEATVSLKKWFVNNHGQHDVVFDRHQHTGFKMVCGDLDLEIIFE